MTERKTALLIIGMHRSGTSVLSRLCNLMGADLGTNLIPAAEDNEKGFWENQNVVNIHDELLKELNSEWEDFLPLPNDWQNSSAAQTAKGKIAGLIQKEFKDTKIFAIKDPRVSILLPIWNEVLEALGITPVYILAYRNPLEVAASLNKRNQLSEKQSLLSWLHHNLSAEFESRNSRRVFVPFPDIFSNWRGIISEIGSQIDGGWPNKVESIENEVQEFISPELKHHNMEAQIPSDSLIEAWSSRVFGALQDHESGENTFDEVRNKFYSLLAPAKVKLDKLSSIITTLADGLKEKQAALAIVEEANAKLNDEVSIHLNIIKDLDAKRHENAVRIDELTLKCSNQEKNIKAVEDELRARTKEFNAAKESANKLQDSLNNVYASTSWKLTEPIRQFAGIVKKKP